jgi:hypothetical protein
MSRQSSTSVSHGTDPAHSQCEGKLPFLRWWPAKSPVQAVAFKWQSTSGSAREQSRLRYGPLGKPSTGIPQFEIVALSTFTSLSLSLTTSAFGDCPRHDKPLPYTIPSWMKVLGQLLSLAALWDTYSSSIYSTLPAVHPGVLRK